jgi:FkbM family methyltransferase
MPEEHRRKGRSRERLGSEYGGWYLPVNHELDDTSICYLVGAGEDVSFDLAIAKQFNSHIRIVDPTPKAVAHLDGLREAIATKTDFPINNSKTDFYDLRDLEVEKIKFNAVGLSGKREVARFYAPRKENHASYSMLNIQKSEKFIDVQCVTLNELMVENGDNHIDLLKLDIEGAEYGVLENLIKTQVFPRILLVEFDELHTPLDGGSQKRVEAIVSRVLETGYELENIDSCNYTFFRPMGGSLND